MIAATTNSTTPTSMDKVLKTMTINKFLHPSSACNAKSVDNDDNNTVATESTDLSSSTSSTTSEKSVTFAPMVGVRQIISRSDYSSEELKSCWYDAQEYSDIGRKCASQIEKLDRGEKLNGKKYCTRGLEGHTESRALQRQASRENALYVVLDEQAAQDYEGNWEAIAKVSRAATARCQSWAHMVALWDERAVQKIMSKEESS